MIKPSRDDEGYLRGWFLVEANNDHKRARDMAKQHRGGGHTRFNLTDNQLKFLSGFVGGRRTHGFQPTIDVLKGHGLVEFIHRAVGYSATGDTTEQCLFMGYGTGANGKTTFLRAMQNIFGDYGHAMPFSTIEMYQRSAIPNDVAALEECGKKGVPAVTIITAGFAETGDRDGEDRLNEIAKKYNIRFLGTNCFGAIDPTTGADTMFLPRYKLERPKAGSISFISQSGATLSVVMDVMGMKGYKISKAVSYGNATNIDEADLIEYLANDKPTKVICAYMEGVKEGRKFYDTAKKLSKKKPIIILKGGTTEAGSHATQSHTGSLAGSTEVYDAAFKQAGIIKANDLEQLFDFSRVLSTQPRPKGDRVLIITDGGGYGVLTTDWIARHNLSLATLSPSSKKILRKQLPPRVNIRNPLDLTGDANTSRYTLAIETALKDPGVDMLAVIPLFQVPTLTGDVVEVITEAKGKKPMVVIAGGGKYTEVLKKSLEDAGVPTFSYPERGVSALKALYDYSRNK